MTRPFVFIVVFHCLWVWKGRTDVSEPVYRLERGPWQAIDGRINLSDLE